MGEKEERGSWQERRDPDQLHLQVGRAASPFRFEGGGSPTTDFVTQVGGPPPCSERRGGKTRRGGARGEGGWSPHLI